MLFCAFCYVPFLVLLCLPDRVTIEGPVCIVRLHHINKSRSAYKFRSNVDTVGITHGFWRNCGNSVAGINIEYATIAGKEGFKTGTIAVGCVKLLPYQSIHPLKRFTAG